MFGQSWRGYFRLFPLLGLSAALLGCSGSKSFVDSLPDPVVGLSLPSGTILVASNSNGAAGPGLLAALNPDGTLNRLLYDYTKNTTGFTSGLALLPNGYLLGISDSGGTTSNDSLDLFNFFAPGANPTSLFTGLNAGGAGSYMRAMAFAENTSTGRYLVFVSEQGNNRIARLSSVATTANSSLSFARDFNFANNGTCTLTTPWGVAYIPSTGNIAVVHSAATGRINIFNQGGTCVGSTAATNTPTGVAYHATSNRLLVTYSGNSTIVAHNASTGAASPATAIYNSATQLNTPRAIATDASGYIYVGSDGNDQIVKLFWDGVASTATLVGVLAPTAVYLQNITALMVVP